MLAPNPDANHDDDDDNGNSATNYIVLAVVAVIVAIGIFVVWEMKKESDRENCYAAGGRNCTPPINMNH